MQNDKLEEFLILLSDKKNYPIDTAAKEMDFEERRERLDLLLTYLSDEYAATVWSAAEKKEQAQREVIMENLMSLYPLSQALVRHILQREPQSDGFLIRGADAGGKVFKKLKEIVAEMRKEKTSNGESMTTKFQKYEADIQKLEADVNKLEDDSKELQKYKDKKRELEEKKEQLEKDRDPEAREQILASLNEEIEKIKDEKESFTKTVESKKEYLSSIKRELSKEKDNVESSEEKRLLRELLKNFPLDEGGDDA